MSTPRNPFAPPDPSKPRSKPLQPQQESLPPPTPPEGQEPKPESEPPSLEDLKKASSTTFRFGAVLILAMLATQLPIPYTLIAPVFIVGAIVMGVIALRKSWAISRRNLMTPLLIAGIIMAAMMSVTAASKFMLWPVEVKHQECVRLALTNSAKAECQVAYQDAVADYISSLRGTGTN